MTATLPTLVARPDRPVDAIVLAILRRTDAATREMGINYFVGGALARDLILMHVFGKDTGRATRDVDLGISINDWETLALLKANLIGGGDFHEQKGMAHRLIYKVQENANGIPLDLLPFGGVAQTDMTIAWPPDIDVVMSVAGFSEAHQSSLTIDLGEGLLVPVASLPALAMLKLIAWRDRHLETAKDVTDFLLIARHYHEAGNIDRLYDTEPDLLIETEYDPELAGAILLGKDVAAISSESTAGMLASIMGGTQTRQRMLDQLLRASLSSGDEIIASRVEGVLNAFHRGLQR